MSQWGRCRCSHPHSPFRWLVRQKSGDYLEWLLIMDYQRMEQVQGCQGWPIRGQCWSTWCIPANERWVWQLFLMTNVVYISLNKTISLLSILCPWLGTKTQAEADGDGDGASLIFQLLTQFSRDLCWVEDFYFQLVKCLIPPETCLVKLSDFCFNFVNILNGK